MARRSSWRWTTPARLEFAQGWKNREKLLKIGAHVRVTVRKVWLSLSSGYPYQALFARIYESLRGQRRDQTLEVSM